jgi:hypothetical protein
VGILGAPRSGAALGEVLAPGDAGLVVVYPPEMADGASASVTAASSPVHATAGITGERLAADVRSAEANGAASTHGAQPPAGVGAGQTRGANPESARSAAVGERGRPVRPGHTANS